TINMIEESLRFIKVELNKYFNLKLGFSLEERVDLGHIAKVNEAGGADVLANKTIISLVNIEEDRISRNPENFVRIDNKVVYKNPKVHLNLYCLFSVNKEIYVDALKHLSLVIQYFQFKNVFTHQNSPGLDAGIDKLIFDLNTINFEQINHLWATLGGKYIPSVMYKVRMITIDEGFIEAEAGLIRETEITGKDITIHLMNSSYKILFSIDLPHDYHNRQVGYDGIYIVPDAATEKILNGYKIIVKKFAGNVTGLAETREGKLHLKMNADTKLRFYLKLKDRHFSGITALNSFNSAGKLYYFSNAADNLVDGIRYLTKPISAYDAAVDYEVGSIVKSGTKFFEAIKFSVAAAAHGTGETKFWRTLTAKRFPAYDINNHGELLGGTIVSDGNTSLFQSLKTIGKGNAIALTDVLSWRRITNLQYVTSSDLVDPLPLKIPASEQNVFGVIEIFFNDSVPSQYVLIGPAGEVMETNYVIRFKNRIATWKYISLLNQITAIEDTEGLFVFTKTENQFISGAPIPLLAKPNYNFKSTAGTFINENIQCASASLKPDVNNKSFFSEIFLNN
ncbi:MAG: DUF4255 domain-containing protein, partial [Chitinophagales bacterium]